MGKVLQFPVSEAYIEFEKRSHLILTRLIDIFTRLQTTGSLTMENFNSILISYNIDLYRDLTYADLAIMKFHCENYYNLGSYFNNEND